jgi:hypothetical protein
LQFEPKKPRRCRGFFFSRRKSFRPYHPDPAPRNPSEAVCFLAAGFSAKTLHGKRRRG